MTMRWQLQRITMVKWQRDDDGMMKMIRQWLCGVYGLTRVQWWRLNDYDGITATIWQRMHDNEAMMTMAWQQCKDKKDDEEYITMMAWWRFYHKGCMMTTARGDSNNEAGVMIMEWPWRPQDDDMTTNVWRRWCESDDDTTTKTTASRPQAHT